MILDGSSLDEDFVGVSNLSLLLSISQRHFQPHNSPSVAPWPQLRVSYESSLQEVCALRSSRTAGLSILATESSAAVGCHSYETPELGWSVLVDHLVLVG